MQCGWVVAGRAGRDGVPGVTVSSVGGWSQVEPGVTVCSVGGWSQVEPGVTACQV